jgi:hypothetical protein
MKEDQINENKTHVHELKDNIVQIAILPKVSYRFYINSKSVSSVYFIEIKKQIIKVV